MGFWDKVFPNVEIVEGNKRTRVGNFVSDNNIKPIIVNSKADDIEMIKDESTGCKGFIKKA